MSRTRRALGGIGFGYAHQAVVTLFGLWLTPFLLHRVGQHDLGLWLVSGQVLAYLGLLDLGVIAMLPREVALASGIHEPERREAALADVIGQVRRLVGRQFVLLLAGGALAIFFLPDEWLGVRGPLTVTLVAFAALYPFRILTATLEGLQEFTYLGRFQILSWLLGTLTTVGLILSGFGLYALVCGWIVTQVAVVTGSTWRVRRHYWQFIRPARITQPSARDYLARSKWVSVSQVAQFLLAGSDVLLLGHFLGPAAVVPYACTGKLVQVLGNHPQLLMHVAQPALSELRARESRTRLHGVAAALTQAMLLVSGALAVVILAVNPFFVKWWVGPTQYGGWWLNVAFVGVMILRHWNVATTYTLFCFGHERRLSLTALSDGMVSILSAAVLIHMYGPIGGPVGSMLGVLLVSLPASTTAVARELNVTAGAFIRPVALWALRCVPVAALALLLASWFGQPTFAGLVTVAAPSAIAYAIAMWPLVKHGPVAPYVRLAFPTASRFWPAPVALGHTKS